jgi:dTDP-4-amino-4,6-dideoxygalactose transaminase
MSYELCKELPWDSEFFGVRVARYESDQLTEESAAAALNFCREKKVDCLYLLLPDDARTGAIAASHGFDYVDTRVTLALPLSNLNGAEKAACIRAFEPDDLPALREIARTSHRDSRFYMDPNFDRSRCEALYQVWIERSCAGWADRTFVAECDGHPCGYVTCHLSKAGVGSIGLIAVAEAARGNGLAKYLIAAALDYFRASGMHSAEVATQLGNVDAMQVYERCGFVRKSSRRWFHAWPSEKTTLTKYRIPFNKPGVFGNEYAYVADSVARGHISGDGVYTRKCQKLLETKLDVPRALLTTSCTHSLEMCALLLDIRPGDEVIVPSFTFVSTVNAFVLRGARPIFADIRADTLNIDERLLESLITPRTRAIIVMHYAGVGCEMDSILQIAGRHGIPVIEDNAHGLFALYRGRPLGTFGSLATQSFHETKNIYCGEGGALLINDHAMVHRAEILREKGTNRSAFFRGEVDKYTWVDVGSSYVMSDSLAAFLYAQLEQRDRIQASRKRVWNTYAGRLQAWAERQDIGLPYIPEWCDQAFHMFYLLMPSCEARQALIDHLKSKGILSVFHYVPLHSSPMGIQFGGRPGQCPVTERVSETLVRLPFYNDLNQKTQSEVITAIEEFQVPAPIGIRALRDRHTLVETASDPVTADLVSLAQACEDPAENRIPSPARK